MSTVEIVRLRQERARAWEKAKALLDKADREHRNLTAAERQQFEGLERDNLEARDKIERLEQGRWLDDEARALEASAGRATETRLADRGWSPRGHESDESAALRGWCLSTRAKPHQIEAAGRLGLNVLSPEYTPELRALSGSDTSAGGYSVPNEMMRAFFDAMLFYAPLRQIASVLRTETGADLPLPTVDDTAETGEILGEASAVTTTADPVFGQVVLGSYKYSSKALLVSVELLQDSFIDLPSFLGKKLGERIGRIQSAHFTTGTGTGEPQGVVDISSAGATAAATNAITFDEVVDLVHSVDVSYRPNARLMMHDTVASVVRKLKDSNDHYLWEMSNQVGQPDRLLGYPVVINNGMASVLDTSAKIMLFGDFETYYIRDAGEVSLIRANERWVDTHQVGFLAFQRTDAKGASSTAIKHLITSA